MFGTEGAVTVRETTSTHDIASLTACFCLSQKCNDWLVSLPFTTKIEVIFVFRVVIYGLCDSETAKRMFTVFEQADCALPALDLLEKIVILQSHEMFELARTGTSRWTFQEDVALFSAMIRNDVITFRSATGRTSRAIRRRIQHWTNIARHILSLDFGDITVDESNREVSDEDNDVESVEDEFQRVQEIEEDDMDVKGQQDPEMDVLEWTNMTRGKRMATMAKTGKSIQALKKQCVKFRMSACRAAKQCKRSGRVMELAEMDLRCKEEVDGKKCTLLQQLSELAEKEPKVSRRYPKDVKNFWMQVYSVSPCCFDHVSWLMNGPCHATVKSWMRVKKDVIRNELFNLESVTKIVNRWRRKWNGKTYAFTLSYDACKLDEDLVINQDGQVSGVLQQVTLDVPPIQYKLNPLLYQKLWEQQVLNKNLITHAFVFMLNPVSDARGFPVHAVFSNSGSANEQVTRCIREIPRLLAGNGIHIKFEASDSDNKYRMAFTSQFRVIYQQFSKLYAPSCGTCELCLLDRVELPSPRRCNDIPHILKRWRARLINNERLFLTSEAEMQSDIWLSIDILRAIAPSIPDTAFRGGSMAAMDDFYPRMIFNIDILRRAWSQRRLDVVIFLLPAVCAEIVFRKDGISRERRIEFAFLGFCVCVYYFSYLEDCARCDKRFRCPVISRDLTVDMGNALYCQMRALREIEHEYRAAKVSSVISEHFFARMRRCMGPDQSYDNFVQTLLKTVICDLKDERPTDNLRMRRRLFESALCERGICCLSNTAIVEARDFVSALFRANAVVFSPTADHLRTFAMANEHNLDTSRIIQSFLELAHDVVSPCRFTIHAGQSRMKRIYGRSIISRFQTAAKKDSTGNHQQSLPMTVEERIAAAEEETPQRALQPVVLPSAPLPFQRQLPW